MGGGVGVGCGVAVGWGTRFACTHDARFEEPPLSYVEMIMNANSPAFGEQTGRAEALLPAGGDAHGMSVTSNVRSSPGGVTLACARSVYRQVPG